MHKSTIIFFAFLGALFTSACSVDSTDPSPIGNVERIAIAQQDLTVALYSHPGDSSAGAGTTTGTLYTPASAGHIHDVVLVNGSTPIAGDDDGWAWILINQVGGDGEGLATLPLAECGIGPVAASTTLSLATQDPGCTSLGNDDGMGGLTWPVVASGGAFSIEIVKGGGPNDNTGFKLGAFSLSLIIQ